MVAVIKTGHSIRRIFNYNEHKVSDGVATLILAENYPLDAEDLTLGMRLSVQERRQALNTNVTRNSVHISLNFAPSEEGIEKEKLGAIAVRYMTEIGFGGQPFLVYRHFDAGHPHLHIVTNNIRHDGTRIDLHHLGIRKSEPARKAVEKEFSLVRAEDQKRQQYAIQPISPEAVHYGRVQSKRAIQNVLDFVIGNYRYASLHELNAILRLFNVRAERGNEDSRTFQHNGLLYRIIDNRQNPVGVPIKASSFYSKPTLQNLANRYAENDRKRQPFRQRVKNTIDLLLKDREISIQELSVALLKQGIVVYHRRSSEGQLFGITYIDHTTRCVFNGSALGKAYGAKGLQERCINQYISGEDLPAQPHPTQKETGLQLQADAMNEGPDKGTLESLLQSEHATDYIPGHFKKKKKGKKRNNPNRNK